jgi:REP element-mobilizing transposase RayT
MTKYRRDAPDADMLRCGEDAMRKARGDSGAALREFNRNDGHTYLVVEYPRNVAVAMLVNSLKGVPTRRL